MLLARSFIEESQASIKISPQDNNYHGLNDRLVTLTGTLEEQMRAIDLILSKLAEDPHYAQSINAPFSYPGLSLLEIIVLSAIQLSLLLLQESSSLSLSLSLSLRFCHSLFISHGIASTSDAPK